MIFNEFWAFFRINFGMNKVLIKKNQVLKKEKSTSLHILWIVNSLTKILKVKRVYLQKSFQTMYIIDIFVMLITVKSVYWWF